MHAATSAMFSMTPEGAREKARSGREGNDPAATPTGSHAAAQRF